MKSKATVSIAVALCALLAAQSPESFKARLAPVAMDLSMKINIEGLGNATATLEGNQLSLNGIFDGLTTNATVANIREGPATGVRGPVVFDLSVSKATKGTVTGKFALTPTQVGNLKQGKWYVQIDSEKAPEGNLWGWLLH